MKHTIRQHGQLTQIDCELGSKLLDKNGREIIEGDIVDWHGEKWPVVFTSGAFEIQKDGKVCSLDMVNGALEVVGHVEDEQ